MTKHFVDTESNGEKREVLQGQTVHEVVSTHNMRLKGARDTARDAQHRFCGSD